MTPLPEEAPTRWATLQRAFGAEVRSLAAARMALAAILLFDLAQRARFLEAWQTDAGPVPREAVLRVLGQEAWPLSLHLLGGGTGLATLLLAVHAAVAIALLAGYRTRAATALAFLLTVSLHHRNPAILQAGDVLLRMSLFWGLFLPWGDAWSLDARRRRGTAPRGTWIASAGTAAFLLQLAFVYWFSALLKVDRTWLADGSAVWMALNVDAWATGIGTWLRTLPPGLLAGLTWLSLAIEAFGPFLIFLPASGRLRPAAFVLFAGFHLSLGAALTLGTFQWIPVAAWLAVLPGWCWDRLGLRAAPEDAALRGARLPTALGATAALVLALVAWQNLGTVEPAAGPPAPLLRAMRTLGLAQRWGMFAPHPGTGDGWIVARATWPDGRAGDLMRDGAPVTWEKPSRLSASLPNQHWRKYAIEWPTAARRPYRPYFTDYLCRTGGSLGPGRGAGGGRPALVEVFWVLELTRFDHQVSRPVPVQFDVSRCDVPAARRQAYPTPRVPALDPLPR